MMLRKRFIVPVLVLMMTGVDAQQNQDGEPPFAPSGTVSLSPTNHPVVSRDVSRLWFAPPAGSGPVRGGATLAFADAMKLAGREDYAKALPLLTANAREQGPLSDYAAYYAAIAQLRLGRGDEARRALQALQKRPLVGYLAEAAAFAEAECAEALGDFAGAADIYQQLTSSKTNAPDDVWMRLAEASKQAGQLDRAREAYGRVYFDFPTSPSAALAGDAYDSLPNAESFTPLSRRYTRELGRGESLFRAGKYAEARVAFLRVQPLATGAERDLVQIRLAQIDYHFARNRQARDALKPYTEKNLKQAEVLYFYGRASRNLNDHSTYVRSLRRVADKFPGEQWAEEALNSLATHYILIEEEDTADKIFRELYAKYPKGIYAERAAWKIGWRAYRERKFADTISYFERGAADFPRSDYRPSWLYWSGRAYEHLRNQARANERFILTTAEYLNSYYGRLAVERLKGIRSASRVVGDDAAATAPEPPNATIVKALLDAERYDDALNELKYAQRIWGDSSSIQATISWIQRQQGTAQGLMASEQFALMRGSITTMRRAYPQFMAAGGEDLPRDVLRHVFPLEYWDLIQKYSAQHRLDKFLVAALVAQESTFVPAVRSSAGAVGLMQLMPATGRRYAGKLKIAYSARLLTDPEANIRMGTAYLADLFKEFGDPHLVLASYNAGEKVVRVWRTERHGLSRDEFIDDIPYPETQNYVKRILGTAEDYRRLYGS